MNKYKLILILVLTALFGQQALAQSKRITGVVKDDLGEPAIGVSIIEKGNPTNGAATGLDGEFALTVSRDDAVIIVSYVGFATQEINVKGKTVINVALSADTEMLEEVVVTGYGSQKKESLTGAISQINSKELLRSPAANVSQAIAGKITGLVTTQTSGAPGEDDVQLFIRGRATFAGEAQPLVLVDGVERSFSQIAPDDVETFSVLKDASATAVYGVRGANGVVLITTKRGKDQRPEVNLTANWQYNTPTRKVTYLDSYNSVMLLEEAYKNDGLPSQYSASDLEMYKKSVAGQLSGVDAMLYPNVNWYDEVIGNYAPAERYNISVRGGTKRMRYYVSGEYYNQSGLVKELSQDKYGNKSNSHYRRFAFRANTDFFLTKELKLSINFGTRFEERSGSNLDGESNANAIFYLINRTPGWLFPVKYNVLENDDMYTLYGGTAQYQNNIVAILTKGGYYNSTNTINETNFIFDYKMDWLTQGLSAKAMVSFDYDSGYRRDFFADTSLYEYKRGEDPNLRSSYIKYGTDTELAYGSSASTTYKVYMEAQLNYARKFGLHDVAAMAIYTQNDLRKNSELARRYQGISARATYGFDDRYLAEVNMGYNGSENFMKGRRFGFFPAFSLGWRLSNESFMKPYQDWLSNLKLRASYGEVGNDNYIGQRFLYEEMWSQLSNDYRFGTTAVTGIYENRYPNYTVTWERAHKFNAGLEYSLWSGLLSGTFEVFYEKRNDILTSYGTRPEWLGVSMAAANLGRTTNGGVEIELSHFKQVNDDLSYNVKATFAHAKNKIVYQDEPPYMTSYLKREGHPIKQYFGLIAEGFVTSADLANPDFPVSTFGNVQVGDLKYKDMNDDGFIDERDETFIGYTDLPENTYSLTLGADYKNWSFSMLLQGVDHVSRYYDSFSQFAFIDGGKAKEQHLGRWQASQSEEWNLAHATYPLLHYDSYGNHNQRANSFFLKNGAFVRLKNVELTYRLPTSLIKRVGMSEARLYINGSNLITLDHLGSGMLDPEQNGSSVYPIMKTVNFGVNIRF